MSGAGYTVPGTPIHHATVITRRGDRRLMGHAGERRNLCGAEPTLSDLLVRDFLRPVLGVRCPACVKAVSA